MVTNLGVRLFISPFYAADGVTPLAAGTITTKLANTATLVATFADAALSTPNSNPLTLDSSGRAVMYFSPLNSTTSGVSYDVEVRDSGGSLLFTYEDIIVPVPTASGNATTFVSGAGATTTLTIAGGSITPTRNRHAVSPESGASDNLDTIAVTSFPDNGLLLLNNTNGSAAITIRNNQGNIFTEDGNSVVLSTTQQRALLHRDGSNFYVIASPSSASAVQSNAGADGRLTLTSGTPVTTADVTAATTIYYTPYLGNTIDLYDGVSAWNRRTFSELSINISLAANSVQDVFCYDNGGVATLVAGTAWTNTTTRALGLTRQNGVLVLSSDTRYRYLGTFATTAVTNQTEDSLTSRHLWNYYNRVTRPMRRLESTATWSYATTTWRQANSSASNQLSTVIGIAEDAVDLSVIAFVSLGTGLQQASVSIGVNGTTPATGVVGLGSPTVNEQFMMGYTSAVLRTPAEIGRNQYLWLERGSGSGTNVWQGLTSDLMQAGITGLIRG